MMPTKSNRRNARGMWTVTIVSLVCLLLATACDTPPGVPGAASPTSPSSHGGPVRDHGTLLDALRKAGMLVNPVGRISQPFLSVEGESVEVDGQTIQSYEYENEQAAAADAGKIKPDGKIEGTQITWVADPHFYRTGKLLVIYPGTDQKILDALEANMGAPFAVGKASP